MVWLSWHSFERSSHSRSVLARAEQSASRRVLELLRAQRSRYAPLLEHHAPAAAPVAESDYGLGSVRANRG